MQNATTSKSILGEAIGLLNQTLNGSNIATQAILTRAEHCTCNLNHILVTWQVGTNGNRVAILHTEATHIKLVDVINRVFLASGTVYSNGLFISIACKTTCILNQGCNTLVLLHLVSHGALYITCNINDILVRTYHDDIVLG